MLGGSLRKSLARPRRALQLGQRTYSSSAVSNGTLSPLPHGLHFHSKVCFGGGGGSKRGGRGDRIGRGEADGVNSRTVTLRPGAIGVSRVGTGLGRGASSP